MYKLLENYIYTISFSSGCSNGFFIKTSLISVTFHLYWRTYYFLLILFIMAFGMGFFYLDFLEGQPSSCWSTLNYKVFFCILKPTVLRKPCRYESDYHYIVPYQYNTPPPMANLSFSADIIPNCIWYRFFIYTSKKVTHPLVGVRLTVKFSRIL